MGTVRCCKGFLPLFKEQAIKGTYKDARILNNVSMGGLVSGSTGMVAYHASKFAAQAFSICLRNEMAAFGIQVTTINPSFHETPMTESMGDDSRKMWEKLPGETRAEYGEGTTIASFAV
jgi:NAD(P)-dependent dehydrogenase (short-subunit alcohol dehydrogenase family)